MVHIETNIVDVGEQRNGEGGANRRLEISYEDGETVCKGHWNPDNFRLEGHVYQRLQTNDGVFHTSDSATHVFTLSPCTFCFPVGRDGMNEDDCLERSEKMMLADSDDAAIASPFSTYERDLLSRNSRAIAAHRNRTYDALLESLRRFNELFQHLNINRDDVVILFSRGKVGPLTEKQEVLSRLRECNWDGLIGGTFLQSEVLCAGFRRRSSTLNNLTFESSEDLTRCMDQWKTAKMDLAAAHADWDEWSKQIQSLILFGDCDKFDRWPATQRRIYLNFESLESAYQRASTRLPRKDLARYEIPCMHRRAELIGNTCIICQSPLLDEVEVGIYELPCCHFFHKTCVQQWLHDNSSCPVCRFVLPESTKKS